MVIDGPLVLVPSESIRNGVMRSVPGVALAGIATVSLTATESRSRLLKSSESDRVTAPVVLRPSDLILTPDLPLTETMIDFPRTANVPDAGLVIFTSGGARLPTVSARLSVGETLPAPSIADAVTNTGLPRGTDAGATIANCSVALVLALVKVVSNVLLIPPATFT